MADDLKQSDGPRVLPDPSADGTAPRRRRATRGDFLATALAVLAASVVVVLAHGVFRLGNTLALAVVAYASFVGTLVVAQVAENRRSVTIDLRGEQSNEARPVLGGLVADPTEVIDLDIGDTDARLDDTMELPSSGPDQLDEDRDPSEDRPRRQRKFTRQDLGQVVAAAAAATAFAAIIRVVWGLQGPTGTALWWYVGFLLAFFALVRDRASAVSAIDRVVTVIIWSIAILITAVLVWMMVFLLGKGLPALRPGFFTEDLSKVGPLTPGGGAYHAIVGTVEQVGLAIFVVVPIGILTAVYLHEMRGRLSPPIRFIVDAMSGLPSIVAGLLLFTVWVDGRGFSGAAASGALVVLMLPTMTRTAEEILRTIPDSLREASLALGAPQWRVVLKVVLPTARSGLVTAAILTVARGIGETAPALLTAFGSDTTNTNPFKGPQDDLPLFVWKLIRLPNETQVQRGWTGLLVLVMLVLVLFLAARFVANRGQKQLGRSR